MKPRFIGGEAARVHDPQMAPSSLLSPTDVSRAGDAALDLGGANAEALAQVAHVLGRCAIAPHPGRVAQALADHGSAAAVLAHELERVPQPFDPPGDLDVHMEDADDELGDGAVLAGWWLDRLRSPDAGLTDRLAWFWHGLLTTSMDKAPVFLCWRQLRTIHDHALGRFGDLLRALLDDAAMAVYLDADGSRVQDPNENLARELLELFTLGRGNYSEDDVRHGARVLAGRALDWSTGALARSDDQRPPRPGAMLGRDGVSTVEDLVAAVLGHRSCAPYLVGRLWRTLIGGEVDEGLATAWGDDFRNSGYEIAPLVSTMLQSDAFARSIRARPRDAVEWWCATMAVTDHDEAGAWDLDHLGQMPYRPPNVAGWPDAHRWLDPTQLLARGSYLTWFEPPAAAELATRLGDPALVGGDRLVDAVMERCSLYDVSAGTLGALRALAADVVPVDGSDATTAVATVLRAALVSPEFLLA